MSDINTAPAVNGAPEGLVVEAPEGKIAMAPSTMPPSTHPGANHLLDQACIVINKAYEASIGDIEGMITRLQNLKASLEIKKKAVQLELTDFVHSVGHTANTVKELHGLVGEIEKRHVA